MSPAARSLFTLLALVATAVGGLAQSISVTDLQPDPFRPRVYALQHRYTLTAPNTEQAFTGLLVAVHDGVNNGTSIAPVGRYPSDLAFSPDGSEIAVINALDASVTIINATSLQVKETIALPVGSAWTGYRDFAHVAFGRGDILYFADSLTRPSLRVYNRATNQIIQTRAPAANEGGFAALAVSPDGRFLYARIDGLAGGAGDARSASVATFAIAEDGTLSILDRYAGAGAGAFSSDGYVGPVPLLVDARGTTLFASRLALKTEKLSFVERIFPGAVISITPGGELVATTRGLYDGFTGAPLLSYSYPYLQAITPDGTRLYRANPFDSGVSVTDLTIAIDPAKRPRDVSPRHGATTTSPDALTWTPGPAGAHYHVYFGDSEAAVANATPASPEYRGDFSSPSFPVGGALATGQTYYWRYDVVTAYAVLPGLVASFRVEPIGFSATSIQTSTVAGVTAQPVEIELTSNAAVAWEAESDHPWAKLVASSGSSPSPLRLVLDASQLAVGTHTANVTVKLAGGRTLQTIPLSLRVDPLKFGKLFSDRSSSAVYMISQDLTFSDPRKPGHVVEIDSTSGKLVRALPAGSDLRDLAIHLPENRLYVSDSTAGALRSFDKTSFAPLRVYAFVADPRYNGFNEAVNRIAAGKAGELVAEISDNDTSVHLKYLNTETGDPGVVAGEGVIGDGEFSIDGNFYYRSEQTGASWTLRRYGGAPVTPATAPAPAAGSTLPVYPTEDGQRIFWAGNIYDGNLALVAQNAGTVPLATDGHLTYRNRKVYDRNADKDLYALPADLKEITFNSTSGHAVMHNGVTLQFLDLADDPAQPVPAPVLTLSAAYAKSLVLSWNDPSPFETSFTLQGRVAGENAWQDLATIPANTISYVVENLTAQTSYEFRLRADAGAQRTSDWSNLLAATTTAYAGEAPRISLERPTSITTASANAFAYILPQGSNTTWYVEYGPTPALGFFTASQSAGSGTQYSAAVAPISGLAPATLYYYRFVASNANGISVGLIDNFYTRNGSPGEPPVIYNAQVRNVTATSVRIDGAVQTYGVDTSYFAEYGTSTPITVQSEAAIVGAANTAVPVSVYLTGLTPNTTYYYHLRAANAAGTTSTVLTLFKTLPEGTTREEPDVTIIDVTNIAAGSAQVNVSIDPRGKATQYVLQYGTVSPLDKSTAAVTIPGGAAPVPVAIQLTGLSPNTTYFFQLYASNIGSGFTTYTPYGSFRTLAPSTPVPPDVSLTDLTNVTTSGAQVEASINPHGRSTSFVVEYGATASLGLSTSSMAAGSASVSVPVHAMLSGLDANTTYYYRVRATSSAGSNVTPIASFTTAAVVLSAPTVTQASAAAVTSVSAQIDATVNPNGSATTLQVEYGTSPSLGLSTTSAALGNGMNPVASSLQLGGLAANTTYFFRVRASNTQGDATSAVDSFTTPQSTASSAPVVSITYPTDVRPTQATVNALVNARGLATTLVIEYDTNPSGFAQSTAGVSAGSSTNTVAVATPLTGLAANTTYYYRGRATNSAGVSYTGLFSFTTPDITAPPAPTIFISRSPEFTPSGYRVEANINPNGSATTVHAEYGTTQALGQSTPSGSIGSGTSPLVVGALLPSARNTTFYYRLVAVNAGGTSATPIGSYTTRVGGVTPPSINAIPVSEITPRSAQVNASINPNGSQTTFVVQYGLTQSLGQQTAPAAVPNEAADSPVSAQLTGLLTGTTYYYRVAATSSAGTSTSTVASFTTLEDYTIAAPEIASVSVTSITSWTVQVQASVNPRGLGTTVVVDYGTSGALSQSTSPQTIPAGTNPVAVSLPVTGLSASTTYSYRVRATNTEGETASSVGTFKTADGPTGAPIIEGVSVSNITAHAATVGGSVNPNGLATTVVVVYGTSGALSQSTSPQTIPAGTNPVSVSLPVTGLSALTTYWFRVRATNAEGETASSVGSFNTAGDPAEPPIIEGVGVSNITAHAATVGGSVDPNGPNTTYSVQYGTTASLGQQTPATALPDGTTSVPVSVQLTNLLPNTTYHYRLTATNRTGTAASSIQQFTTPAQRPAPLISNVNFFVAATTASASAFVDSRGSVTSVFIEYGTTTALGSVGAAVTVPARSSGSKYVAPKIDGLTPNTKYHWRLTAQSAAGSISTDIASFTTSAQPPLVVIDDSATTLAGQAIVLDVLANDFSPNGDQLQVASVGKATAGTARLRADGKIVYTPGAAFQLFDHFRYTVTDQHNHIASAVVNIQSAHFVGKGRYSALLGEVDGDYHHTGSITLNVSEFGLISGKLCFAGGTYAIRTQVRADATVRVNIPRAGQPPLVLSLDLNPEPTAVVHRDIAGAITIEAERIDFSVKKLPLRAPVPVFWNGRYTVLLPYSDPASPAVNGIGFATLNVTPAGSVQVAGRTPAGAPFSAGAYVSEDGFFPLYAAVASPNRLSFHGVLQFWPVAGTSDLDGRLGWSAAAGGPVVSTTAIGSRYTAPGGNTPALPFPRGTPNARIDIWNDSEHLTANPLHATLNVRALTSSDSKLRNLALVSETGLFSGSVLLNGKTQPFFGVIFQAQGLGAGLATTVNGTAALQLVDPARAASVDNQGVSLKFPPASN